MEKMIIVSSGFPKISPLDKEEKSTITFSLLWEKSRKPALSSIKMKVGEFAEEIKAKYYDVAVELYEYNDSGLCIEPKSVILQLDGSRREELFSEISKRFPKGIPKEQSVA